MKFSEGKPEGKPEGKAWANVGANVAANLGPTCGLKSTLQNRDRIPHDLAISKKWFLFLRTWVFAACGRQAIMEVRQMEDYERDARASAGESFAGECAGIKAGGYR